MDPQATALLSFCLRDAIEASLALVSKTFPYSYPEDVARISLSSCLPGWVSQLSISLNPQEVNIFL
jgi:hypothetical protein